LLELLKRWLRVDYTAYCEQQEAENDLRTKTLNIIRGWQFERVVIRVTWSGEKEMEKSVQNR